MNINEQQAASFLVLAVAKLTGWTPPASNGNQPSYLSKEQTRYLALKGVELLAQFIPAEDTPKAGEAAGRDIKEEFVLSVGSPGGNNPPGCCFGPIGHMICVR